MSTVITVDNLKIFFYSGVNEEVSFNFLRNYTITQLNSSVRDLPVCNCCMCTCPWTAATDASLETFFLSNNKQIATCPWLVEPLEAMASLGMPDLTLLL